MQYPNLSRLGLAIATALTVGAIDLSPDAISNGHLHFDSAAQAKSTGGRAGGGSFKSAPPSSGGSSRPSGGYSGGGYSGGGYSGGYSRPRPYYEPGPVVVPVPVPPVYGDPYGGGYRGGYGGTTYTSVDGGSLGLGILVLALGAGGALFVITMMGRGMRGSKVTGSYMAGELTNDIVTVSKVQVVLLAQARDLQLYLNQIGQSIDTSSREGLQQLMQETLLALLRTPENWSHVLADSKTVKTREEAEALFNRWSITERSKFSSETLVNVGGSKRRDSSFKADPNEGPAAYIVITMLVGTEHDNPLFGEIRTEEGLKDALQKLAAMPPEYLMVFEVLWSPQDPSDTLTYEELLAEYADVVQI